MAAETKIGLLVGLAFIVCFGVILSHSGRGERTTTDVAIDLLNRYQRTKPPASHGFSSHLVRDRNVDDAAAARLGAPMKPAESASRTLTWASDQRNDPTPARNEEDQDGLAEAEATSNILPEKLPTQQPTWEELFADSSEQRREDPEQHVSNSVSSHDGQASSVHDSALRPAVGRYVVQPGDTLWRIAEHAYGRRGRVIVDAIFAANRDRMKSPDELGVGVSLTLPVVENIGAPVNVEPAPKHGEGGVPASPAAPARYYQVQQGDRYATIAQRFLGKKSRWRELYELNKDVFPDAGRIRPGVRIRIPATVIAEAHRTGT